MNDIIKPKKKPTQKGYADVVFIVDSSGSMTSVINGLKNHIEDFIQGLNSGNSVSLSWRIGIIGADTASFQIKDFTDSVDELKDALEKIKASDYTEASYQAIDYAASMEWRPNSKKILVFFTDEPLSGGQYYEESAAKTEELAQKLNKINLKFFMFNPPCPDYEKLSSKVNGAFLNQFEEIEKIPFNELLNTMGKTISDFNYQAAGSIKEPLIFEHTDNGYIDIVKL